MKDSIKSVLFMFLVALVFTGLVSAVKLANDQRIARNQEIKLQRIILQVLKIAAGEGISEAQLTELYKKRVKPMRAGNREVYIGYQEDGKTPLGYALPFKGPGFWGPISGLVSVDPKAEKIRGLAFYKHSETPGLGGRITENWFQTQFEGLALTVEKGPVFKLVPTGASSAKNELDAITGATMTSKAVEAFLNQEIAAFAQRLRAVIKSE